MPIFVTMKKIAIHRPGSFNQLKIEEHHGLTPQSGEIKVNIHAIGINYADVVIRWGLYESAKKFVGWPITPGFEFSGTVAALGTGISGFEIGQQVFGISLFNGYATEICVPQHQLFHVPHGITLEAAAGFPAVYMTAYHALLQLIIVRPGEKTIIHSAAGGVGSALLQLCRIKGMETIGVVGSSHKVTHAREMGATHVIDKSKQDVWQTIRETYPDGPDVIFDANGGESLQKGWDLLKRGGKMVSYGTHTILPKESGRLNYPKLVWSWLRAPRFHSLQMNQRSIVTFNLSFMFDKRELLEEAMRDLIRWMETGEIKPLPVTSYAFENVAQAHRDLQSGKTVGKLVLIT